MQHVVSYNTGIYVNIIIVDLGGGGGGESGGGGDDVS